MKNKLKLITAVLCMGTIALTSSCKKDKNVYAEDFAVTIAENPADSLLLGTIIATTEKSYITYSLKSESVAGALFVDESSGELYVKDASKFNYEANITITAEIEATNEKTTDIANVTITLTDVVEIPAVIGDFRDGGIVFWVDPNDDTKGLVCAVADQSLASADWGCYSLTSPTTINGADGTAVGTGAQNTVDIVADCTTSGTAADICSNLSLGGFSDWFLPSKDEMTEMYNNKGAINTTAAANSGASFDEGVLYWTSSEFDANKAYDFYFFSGLTEGTLKLNTFNVRAVRAF